MRLPLIRLLAAIIVAALLSPAAALDYLPSGPAASPPSDGRARGLATVYQPAPYALLQTFWIGANGAVRAVRKERNGRWRQAYDLTPPRWGIPDSPVAAAWQDAGELLRVFWVDSAGTANLLESEHGAGEDRAGRLFRAGRPAVGGLAAGRRADDGLRARPQWRAQDAAQIARLGGLHQ
jgi:hypothetical protein